MRLKLKEDPREWKKFAAVWVTALLLVTAFARWKQKLDNSISLVAAGVLLCVLAVAWLRPRWFRQPYRMVMTASFHVGQRVGKVLLTVLFLLILTPLALALRLFGKRTLPLQLDRSARTYWQPARKASSLDRMF